MYSPHPDIVRLYTIDQLPIVCMSLVPDGQDLNLTPYLSFSRKEWKALRDSTPLSLNEKDLEEIRGINENISMEEVVEIYLPISRLLHLYYKGSRSLHDARSEFLDRGRSKIPFIIGIAGSVAVGKSTTARLLKTLISAWPESPKVDLIPTDGFIHPNSYLEEKGIMNRKGFPESYDLRKLISFLYNLKSGEANLRIPVYSHIAYDIVPGKYTEVSSPDIVLLEGLNVLQSRSDKNTNEPELLVSDFFDFSIYLDADDGAIKKWYIDRFKVLMKTAFVREDSYFHDYSYLSEKEAEETAGGIWDSINLVNLIENIAPTKFHAHLILEKDVDHRICKVHMRKI